MTQTLCFSSMGRIRPQYTRAVSGFGYRRRRGLYQSSSRGYRAFNGGCISVGSNILVRFADSDRINHRLLSLTFNPRPVFESLILVELMIMNQEQSRGPGRFLLGASSNRRDTWPSKEEAYVVMKSRKALQVWDDRVLRLFVVSIDIMDSTLVNLLAKGTWPSVITYDGLPRPGQRRYPKMLQKTGDRTSGLITKSLLNTRHMSRPVTTTA